MEERTNKLGDHGKIGNTGAYGNRTHQRIVSDPLNSFEVLGPKEGFEAENKGFERCCCSACSYIDLVRTAVLKLALAVEDQLDDDAKAAIAALQALDRPG